MPREEFFDSLRIASRTLATPKVITGQGAKNDQHLASLLHSADFWLTPKSVAGFDPADFDDWPKKDRDDLTKEVGAFVATAKQVPPTKPPTKAQSQQGRKHLERIIQIVAPHVLKEWLKAQQSMQDEAVAAANAKGWHFQQDEKQLMESLLGKYNAPRLRIRTPDKEIVLDPIARFGGGRQGVVDLVVMPTFETKYLITFKNGNWHIMAPHGSLHRRPFTQATLVNTITHLSPQ